MATDRRCPVVASWSIGSTGKLRCLEARTGRLVWESPLGPETERFARLKAKCLADRQMPRCKMDFCSAPVVVDGVVVCGDNREGLLGIDADTGRPIWGPVSECINKASSPTCWESGGKAYVIAASRKAVCVEPKTGRVLWEVTDVANAGTVAVNDRYMVLSGGSANCNERVRTTTGMMCYRITPQSAERAWALDPEYCNHVTSPVIYQEHVYGFSNEATVCIELATGKVVAAVAFPGTRSCSSLGAADGRILREHLYQRLYWYRADPRGFTQLGDPWRPPPHAENTTAAIADGRLILRGKDGLYCYDLRKPEVR